MRFAVKPLPTKWPWMMPRPPMRRPTIPNFAIQNIYWSSKYSKTKFSGQIFYSCANNLLPTLSLSLAHVSKAFPATGYFADADLRCLECHAYCSSCTILGSDYCIECAANYVSLLEKILCSEECPEYYNFVIWICNEYATCPLLSEIICFNISDEKRNTCIHFQPQCRECDSSLSCTACEFRLLLKNGHCLAPCQSGLYETDDHGCDDCHPDAKLFASTIPATSCCARKVSLADSWARPPLCVSVHPSTSAQTVR